MIFGGKNRLIGLDLGSSEIKAIEVQDLGSAGLAVSRFAKARIRSEDEKAIAVRELVRQVGFKTRRVTTSISGRSVIVRYITMPQMNMDELRNAIRFEADKYIPFEVDEVQMDCAILEPLPASAGGQPEMKVLLVAVKRSIIEDHVAMLTDAGLQPVAVDVDSFAIGNAFEVRSRIAGKVAPNDRVLALIDIGASKTNITIMRGQVNCFSREVYSAGNEFTEAIARKLGLDPSDAEQTKCMPADRGAEVEAATKGPIDDLCNEIQLSFDYFEHQFDKGVDEVYLSGGSARLPGLVQTLQSKFEREVNQWNPLDGIEIRADGRIDTAELQRSASQLAVPLGLAARVRKW